ncbi:MAG: RUS1 family protein, partial [Candidatus Eremiobacterota bacterium]
GSDQEPAEGSWLERTRRQAWDALVPENLSHSVSRDYVPVRKWQLVRDFLGSFSGSVALVAVMTAVGPANAGLAALSVAGLTVANVIWLKDRLAQVSHIAATSIARVAERNPRPWIMAADVVQNVGTVLDASTAVLPPLVYYPLLTAVAAARAVFGAASSAASANIAPRQALKGNLGEVSVKNSNQSTLTTLLGATAGTAALGVLSASLGFGPAALIISALGAGGCLVAEYMKLQALEYDPINERAMRRVLEQQEKDGTVPGPDRDLLGQMTDLLRPDQLIVGDRVRPLLEDPAFPELRQMYRDRPYFLALRDGLPCIVLKQDAEAQDRPQPMPEINVHPDNLAQVQAVYQAVTAERLLEAPEFAARTEREGRAAAERWVLEESLRRTPSDIRPFMRELREAGWSADMVRFRGEERPVLLSETPA